MYGFLRQKMLGITVLNYESSSFNHSFSKEINTAVFIFLNHMVLIENEMMDSLVYFIKALKSNI